MKPEKDQQEWSEPEGNFTGLDLATLKAIVRNSVDGLRPNGHPKRQPQPQITDWASL